MDIEYLTVPSRGWFGEVRGTLVAPPPAHPAPYLLVRLPHVVTIEERELVPRIQALDVGLVVEDFFQALFGLRNTTLAALHAMRYYEGETFEKALETAWRTQLLPSGSKRDESRWIFV